MVDLLLYISCGLLAGLLGGYLGLGGGIVMVPFLTVVAGLDIKVAVPVSVSAIVVNSLAASNEYLKKGMVNLEMVVIMAFFSALGSITGSIAHELVPADMVRIILTMVLLYTAVSLLKGRNESKQTGYAENKGKYLVICAFISFFTGALAALVGIGGGVILVPTLYLIIGLPLTTSRGTSSLLTGFIAVASTAIYLFSGQINLHIAAPVIAGIVIGGKVGGRLGTLAKPTVVRVLFFAVMIYLAYRLSYNSILELF